MIDIEARKSRCGEQIRINYKELLNAKGEVDLYKLNIQKNSPREVIEYGFWEELGNEKYWRAFNVLNFLLAREGKNNFSESDLEQITKIMIKQIIEGKEIASSIPMYSDVFRLIGGKESPLEKYVGEGIKIGTLNDGFWNCLRETSCPQKQKLAVEEIDRIMDYELFFNYFDFERGAERAVEMPENPNLDAFKNLWNYVRWFLVQEEGIYRKAGDQAYEVVGKLAAPLVDRLLSEKSSSEHWRFLRLAKLIIDEGIVKTKPVQKVLGETFEYELGLGFEGGGYDFDPEVLRTCAENLVDITKHTDSVWKIKQESVRLSELNPQLKQYVPREAYKFYVEKIRNEIESMNRFDINCFGNWMKLNEKEVSKGVYGKVRNKALEIYFNQKPRPSGNVLENLARFKGRFGSDYKGDKVSGFLFCDLLSRKRWNAANEIIMHYYDIETPKPKRVFFESIQNYTKLHGKINLDKEGLLKRICYPNYNQISDFVQVRKEFFDIKD